MNELQATLDEIHRDFEASAPKASLQIMDRSTEELIESGQASKALHEGSEMPDFVLKDSGGTPFSSAQVLDKGPLIVSFFRGFW